MTHVMKWNFKDNRNLQNKLEKEKKKKLPKQFLIPKKFFCCCCKDVYYKPIFDILKAFEIPLTYCNKLTSVFNSFFFLTYIEKKTEFFTSQFLFCLKQYTNNKHQYYNAII